MSRTEPNSKLMACLLASLMVLSVLAMTTAIAGASSGTNQGMIAGNVALAGNVEMPADGGLSVTVTASDTEGQQVQETTNEITAADPNFQYEFSVPSGGYEVHTTVADSTGDVVAHEYATLDVDNSGDYVWVTDGETVSDVNFDVIDFESVQVRHERSALGSSRTDGGDGPPTYAEALKLETSRGEAFALGGNTDRGVTIRNVETGAEVTVVPNTATTYQVDRIEMEGLYATDGTFRASPKLYLQGPDIEAQSVDVTVVSADKHVFNRSVFQTYEVELVGDASTGTPTVVDTTNQRLVGIGYEGALVQNSTHGTIEFTFPRDPEVDDTWDVEFELQDSSNHERQVTKTVVNNAGDETFNVQVNVSEMESSDYHWHLDMYPATPQFGDEQYPADRIIGPFGFEAVTIQRATFDVTPAEPDVSEPVSFDASDSVGRNGDIVEYQWSFGDGTTQTTQTPTVEHTYDSTGEFDVQLTVVDEQGNEETTTQTVPVVDTITVEGTFTESDGEPAADDTVVVLTETDFFTTRTDANGAFSMDIPAREAPYDIQYYQGDVTSEDLSAAFPSDSSVDIFSTAVPGTEDTDLGTINLPEGHKVDVTVTDEEGTPVEDARILWSDQDDQSDATAGYRLPTNTDGVAEADDGTVFEGLELTGSAEVVVWPPRADTRFADRTYSEQLDVTQADSLTFVLEAASLSANVETNPAEPVAGETMTFDASGSTADTEIAEYVWDFGDGTTRTTTEPMIDHVYEDAGDYEVTLTVRDTEGDEASTTEPVSVTTVDDSDDKQDTRDGGKSHNPGSSSGSSSTDSDETDNETADDTDEEGHGFNVSTSETVELEDVNPDAPGRTVRTENTSVTEITFDDDEDDPTEGNVTISDIDAPPSEIGAPEGSTVGSIEISVPDEMRDTAATIQLTVDRERLEELEATEDELTVERYNESAAEWQTLETTVVESGEDDVVLRAETPGFSYFAVTAQGDDSEQSTPTETETDTPTPTVDDDTPTAGESPSEPDDMAGFGAVVALIAVLAAALLATRRN